MEEKKIPFIVPSDYFDDLQQRLEAIPSRTQPVTAWMRLKPYVAMAASLLVLVTAGTWILERTVPDPDATAAEEWLTETNPYAVQAILADNTDPGPTEEDIIQYLIDSGINMDYYETND